jgi:hypothetical protein
MSDVTCSLWLDGVRIGMVALGLPDEQGRRTGLLKPTRAYGQARSRLQALTHGLAALTGSEAEAVHNYMVSAVASLTNDGLMLRNEDGDRVPTHFLIVGDYYPIEIDVGMLGHALPIFVTAWIANTAITSPAS